MLAFLATTYGIASALAALLQARQLIERRRSCEVSVLLFGMYLGGYILWLSYGLSIGSTPLMLVNAVGVVTLSVVVVVALSLRGSLRHPLSWRSCSI